MTWILYDKETGTVISHGNNQPVGYSADKDIAQVDFIFWDAQPDYLYKYDGVNLVPNDEELIKLFSGESSFINNSNSSITVNTDYSNVTFNLLYDGDVNALLLNKDDYPEGFSVAFLKKVSDNPLTISPFGDNLIDGEPTIQFNGKGKLVIEKRNDEWVVTDRYNYFNNGSSSKTVTVNYDGTAPLPITITHNNGYIPFVKVYTLDPITDKYTETVVSIDHDWDTMNSFDVHLDSQIPAKIVYSN